MPRLFSRFRRSLGTARRLAQILTVFFELGFEELIGRAGLGRFVGLRCRLRCWWNCNCHAPGKPSACAHGLPVEVRFRMALERLGPTFMKMGQVLSVRPDLVPPKLAEELKKLQERAPEIPFEVVKKTVEEELGKPLSELFERFEERPVGSASLAQVHRAVVRPTGMVVAVKVQRPGVREVIEKDLDVLRFLAAALERTSERARGFRPRKTVEEFARWTLRELDFTLEGKNADRFRANFRNWKGVRVPWVCWKHTTPRVLTLEFIEGVRLNDLKGIARLGVAPAQVVSLGVRMVLKQILEDGFFHGDPHPGNLLVCDGGTIALLDLGMVGSIGEREKRWMISYWLKVFTGDTEGAFDRLLENVELGPGADIEAFRREYLEVVASWQASTGRAANMARTFHRLTTHGSKYGVFFPPDQILMAKAMMTIEGVALELDPGLNITREARPFVEKLVRKQVDPLRTLRSLAARLPELMDVLESYPEMQLRMMRRIERGDLGVRLSRADVEALGAEVRGGMRRLWLVLAAAFLAGLAVARFF